MARCTRVECFVRISRAFRFAAFSFSAILLFTTSVRLMADEPPAPDGAAVLSRAAGLVDLQALGGAPFFLLANVSLREGNKTVDGVFAMTWASPGQYHRVFRFPGFEANEVFADGTMYRKRSTEALPLMMWELDQLLSLTANYRPGPHSKVRRVQTEGAGSGQTVCVLTQVELIDSRICVNGATGEPSFIDRGTDISRAPSMHEHFEYSDYQPFEGRTFPGKMLFRGWGGREIEVHVQKLIHAQSFPENEFA